MAEFFDNIANNFLTFVRENIVSVFKMIEWNDILDIILLALIFFFIYRFARRRKAIKLVMGVLLFFLISFVGEAINLKAVSLIFGNFKQIGLIAIIIIFQPELRLAFEKIGGTTFMGIQSINHAEKEKGDIGPHLMIESVSRAAQRLSSMGHGALMVIERVNSLADYKRSGTTLDASVSPDLLCSIFYKGGALHDGAVIIKDGKVESAACVLRMTDRIDIDNQLGTRHRAAIGTTEVSDAVVVVVSEETGNISISIDGNLERNFNYSSLRTRLEEILIPKKKEKKSRARKKKKSENA